ncbi:MAG TPA: hypothetical protein VMR25_19275 [Planctomycetaceae bacterium]|jgi:hypothetical protein|nr:hypothetical protein [Planctomycetaceae bacterium]
MNVRELIMLLEKFPEDLPVYFAPDDEGRVALAPRSAVMNLVHPERRQVIADDDSSAVVPEGFVDSLVIYPRVV